MATRPPCSSPIAETMEERILHSADLGPLLAADAAGGVALQQAMQYSAPAVVRQSSEIAFVDASLPDADSLLADLRAQRDAGRPLEIVLIAVDQDGLSLISDTLAARQGITAVHVLTHGSDGQLQLGSLRLDASALLARAGEVAGWSTALTGDADLLLYGCDLAQTEVGQRLATDLAALTGADVAASTDRTGAAALGGDWALEYQTGAIDAAPAASFALQQQWQGVLATYTVSSGLDLDLFGAAIPGTLRWAISQANANAGADSIVFAVNAVNLDALISGDDSNTSGDLDITDSVNITGNGSATTVISGNGLDRVLDVRFGNVAISGLTIQGGRSNLGAGVRVTSVANLTLTDVVVQNNAANGGSKGVGIYTGGNLTLRNVIVRNNGSLGAGNADGAGIYLDDSAVLDALNVEIRDNLAENANGGGLYLKNSGTSRPVATLINTTIAGNDAKSGGGIYSEGGSVSLFNVTLSGNRASLEGGGLWAADTVSLNHVTVAGNSAPLGGGIFARNSSNSIFTRNSLFAGNTGGNSNGKHDSLGYNLSDDASNGFNAVGDQSNVAAGLAALANNGGFSRTHAIGSTSAARDAADPEPPTGSDQRGVIYAGGRADIGAYEFNLFGAAPTITGIANQTINEDGQVGPLAFTVGDAETDSSSLVVTATSSNPALVANGSLVVGGTGSTRSISLAPLPNANSSASGGASTITVSVSDGGNSTSTTFILDVLAVNDAPTLTLPGPATVAEDTALVLSGATAPRVDDLDAGTAPIQVRLSATNGLLTLGQTSGLSFFSGTGSNNAVMRFSGSRNAINAALDGLQYVPAADFVGSAQLNLRVDDLGNSGSGGALSTSASLAISVTAVNDAPVLSLPGPQTTPEPTPLAFSPGNGNAISILDSDAGSAALRLTLTTINALNNGTLALGTDPGTALLSGNRNGDTTLVLQGSQADLNALLTTLMFTATGPGSAQIDILIDDQGSSGTGGCRRASRPPMSAESSTTILRQALERSG